MSDSSFTNLSPEKLALLSQRLRERRDEGRRQESIPRRRYPGPCPLSFAQERLWFLDQLTPGNAAYNLPFAVRISGPLNVQVLERAFNELVRRHEILRTTFSSHNGSPTQIIEPFKPLVMRQMDVSHLSIEEAEATAREVAVEEARLPFDLGQGPLMRVRLIRLAAEEHVVVLILHHIICDGWSLMVLVRELGRLYEGYVAGGSSPLPELRIQYGDYAVWQREWLQGEVLERQLEYWRNQLAGMQALELASNGVRPAIQGGRGGEEVMALDAELVGKLRQLSEAAGVTLFMTLLAAFQTLLFRYTGQQDIQVGSGIAGRHRLETEDLIGFFVNQLVLRTSFSGNPSFRELLTRVREVTLGAFAHQDLPFAKLVEELQPERSLSHTPLYQVEFVLHNIAGRKVDTSHLQLKSLKVKTQTAKCDLTLEIEERGEELIGLWEYNAELFDANTVVRMSEHFRTLLAELVAKPEQEVGSVRLLSEQERRQVLEEWNNTRSEPRQARSIMELIEEQVAARGEAVALVCEGEELSYAELNRRANQMGHYLQRAGVGAEVVVGLVMGPSVELVVAMLGVLKAGGAYLPLDVQSPGPRLEWMLEAAGAAVVVRQSKVRGPLKLKAGVAEVVMEEVGAKLGLEAETGPVSEVQDDNLAYVIYTSGSTGRPKAVMVTHRALMNVLFHMESLVGIDHRDKMLAVSSPSFDIAELELWLPLISGATVELAGPAAASDSKKLIQLLGNGVTFMQATPATWRLLLMSGWKGSPALRVLCGGEALSAELAAELLDRCARLWNVYGPTETTIWSSVHEVERGENEISIGRPLSNTQLYVLTPWLEPIAAGIVGELYIGGDGVARGYCQNPDLTAERFIPDPFSWREGQRLYRTGDLVFYRETGELRYIGRADDQVKVRGHRIEPREIEVLLQQHGSVKEAAVVAYQEQENEWRLVAFVVTSEEDTSDSAVEGLRKYLSEQLPLYMVPQITVIHAMPLTGARKIDRQELVNKGRLLQRTKKTIKEPRSDVERMLAGIWSEVLNVNGVGIDEDFFALGGHSLRAIQVVSRIQSELQIELSIDEVLSSRTISELAPVVVRTQARQFESTEIAQLLAELEN